MTMLPKCNLLVLRVDDIHRTSNFYKSLGMVLELHAHGNGIEHYSYENQGFVFEIYPATNKIPATQSLRIGFSVENIDTLITAGAKIITAPHDSEWGRRALIRDVDGNVIELINKF